MIKEKNIDKKLIPLYRILFSILTAILGAVLIIQLWRIYKSAPQSAFSRASIAKAFVEILPLILFWFACFIFNIVLSRLDLQQQVKLKGKMELSIALLSMRKRFKAQGKRVAGVKKQRALRYTTMAVGGILIIFACVWSLYYLFDKNYVVDYTLEFFHGHNGLAARLISTIPGLLVATLLSIACEYLIAYTQQKELALLKTAFAEEARRKKAGETIDNPVTLEKGEQEQTWQEKWSAFRQSKSKQFTILLWCLRGALFVSAIVLIVLGVHFGGMDLILSKAREVCQQCIGLG